MEGEAGGDALTARGEPGRSALHRTLARAVDVRPEEVRAMLTAFAYFFLVLSAWFVLRPIRDAMAAASGVSRLPWLFAGTLTATLICNPVYSALVGRFTVRRFIPITYHFFVANLLVFYVLMRAVAPAEGTSVDEWVGRVFFVWTSVFNLFVVSVFWSFLADAFGSEQGKRLFGFISVGGTLGSIAGSAATAYFASAIGTVNLLLISAVLLELAVVAVLRFPAGAGAGEVASAGAGVGAGASGRASGTTSVLDQPAIGGSVWAGVTRSVRSPYLFAIAAFVALYTIGSTFLYFQQSDLVGRFYADRAARTTVLAELELAAQVLTVVTQVFLTGRIIRWFGLAAALAFVPLLGVVGFATLGVVPVFATLAVFTVLRRAGNFALMNPAMDVLFTVTSREDKYKAKSFIDTFVYRGGDQLGAWSYAGLVALGLGFATIAFAAVPMTAVALGLGLWLGRRQGVLARQAVSPAPAAA